MLERRLNLTDSDHGVCPPSQSSATLDNTWRRALVANVADALETYRQSGNVNRGELRSSRVRWRYLLPFRLWPLVLAASHVPRHVRCP